MPDGLSRGCEKAAHLSDMRGPARATTIHFHRPRDNSVFKILVDSCVWLDLAKDYQQQPLLSALEQLIESGDVALILPRVVVEEFARNRSRVIEESGRSLSSTVKRVKDAVEKFGDPRQKRRVLRELNDVDHRIPTIGGAVTSAIGRIEALFCEIGGHRDFRVSQTTRRAASDRQACAVSSSAKRHRRRNHY